MGRTGRWKDARTMSLRLEIHYADQPVHEVATSVWLPRGIRPEVGQDVMYRVAHGDDSTHYDVEWDQSPNYGTAPAPRLHAARGLLEAKQALDRGQVTQDDFDRVFQSAQDGSPADDG